MKHNLVDDRALAALALRLNFLFHALRLDLLPAPIANAAHKLAEAGESCTGDTRKLVDELAIVFKEMQSPLGLEGLDWPSLSDGSLAPALAAALAQCQIEASPRDRAECLGKFCEALLPNRRSSGSYYTPGWLADEIARTALRGVRVGRRLLPSEALSLTVLDPAIGAGAFALGVIAAIAEAMGEEESAGDTRRAAARRCIFGIEMNQFAADACRLAVWLAVSQQDQFTTIPCNHLAVQEALFSQPSPRNFDMVITNPPWGVKLDPSQTTDLIATAPHALSGHRESHLFFLHLAAESTRDDGAIGLLLPDTLLYQVRYEGMRRALLERFRPLRVVLLGDRIFTGAAAPACLLCMAGKQIDSRSFSTLDLRNIPRPELQTAVSQAGSSARSVAPAAAPHASLLLPSSWLLLMLKRLQAAFCSLDDPELGFTFHDAGINYASADLGRAMLYTGGREHPDDIPVVRGRDFGPFTLAGHSAWLRHDWCKRVNHRRVSVRERIYRIAPKVLFRQTADRPVATVDYRGEWFGRSVIAITGTSEVNLLHLAALLNSRSFAALYCAVTPELGRSFAQVKVSKLRLLPVPPPDGSMADLAAALLRENAPDRRYALVRELDAAAHRTYGLSEAEVARVEEMVEPCLSATARPRRGWRGATS